MCSSAGASSALTSRLDGAPPYLCGNQAGAQSIRSTVGGTSNSAASLTFPCNHCSRAPLLDRHDAPLVLLIRRQFRIGLVHPAHDRVIIGIDCEHGVALTTTWEWHDESRHYRKNHRGHDGWKQDWESGVTWRPPYGERPQTDLIIGGGIQAENIQQALLWD